MGITLGRWVQLSIFLGSITLSSVSYGANIWETILEKTVAGDRIEISDLFADDDQDVPDASATGDLNSIVTLDTGGRHLIRYYKADVEEYDSTVAIFIDAEDASVVNDTTTAGGDVDGLEYLVWAANFGSNSTPRTFTPEPTTCSLLVFGALTLMFSRRRR